MSYQQIEEQFSTHLGLVRRPVAIAARDAAPAGVEKFNGTVPSGCTFWRLASEGRTFFTVPGDHYNCAIGAYTHNIPLPADREHELSETLGLMAGIGYIRLEEVPGIPRLPTPPVAVVYAPLGDTPVDPDVVLFTGVVGQMMLLQEAAIRAGVAAQVSALGRPTCMSVPTAMALGTVSSTGCVGNRVYTGLEAGELYVVVPGRDLARVADATATISSANAALLAYHTERRQILTTGSTSGGI